MKRTIKTPHDVVQRLIDIIVTYESIIDNFTLYNSLEDHVKVTINTFCYLYICHYEMTGDRVEIYRYKKNYKPSSKVLEACSFNVHGEYTNYINVIGFPEKIKIINL